MKMPLDPSRAAMVLISPLTAISCIDTSFVGYGAPTGGHAAGRS
jgi:hypothetical protein